MSDETNSPAPQIGEPGFVFDSAKKFLNRRIVLLKDDTSANETGYGGEVEEVLKIFNDGSVVQSNMADEVRQLAERNPGRAFALEWFSNRGWVRYLTVRR